MDIEECLRTARINYEIELRLIDNMIREGDAAEDERPTMQRVVYREYAKKVNECYQKYEGRSTPGLNR